MNAQSAPLVSIVTPVYNERRYLPECIESILAQTYRNWEYIIADNCSTDGSTEIAHSYAQKDSRIRVYENSTFLRALPNHNSALRQISPQSKYCKIVFADDWIFPECLERMVGLAEEHASIGIVGAYVLEGQRVICTGLPYEIKLVNGREICRRHFLNKLYVFGSANAVLYRADLVRNNYSFFNEENIHGDTEACFSLLKTSNFGFVHQVLTFTRVRLKSLSAISSDLQTSLAGTTQVLVAHGRDYLTREELESLLRSHLSRYYRFLGKSLLLGHDKALAYHKKKLLESGVGFSWTRVFVGMLATLFDLAMNPKTSVEKMLETFRNDSRQNVAGWWDGRAGKSVPKSVQGEM